MIYLPQDIPEPETPGYQQGVAVALMELCRATRGRTLVLFTSHAALRTAHAAVQEPLGREGILVLGQGIDGSPKKVLNHLRSNPDTMVFGTSAMWEGVDVVGKALSVLVITRLPFAVPTDPVFAARSELYDDPFNEYMVPRAVLRFKQGFGRLIRSWSDRGVVIIMDRRVQIQELRAGLPGFAAEVHGEAGRAAPDASGSGELAGRLTGRFPGWVRRRCR